jgi:TRAP-type C4-dicarboxylate transport system permease small subunit
VVVVAFAASVLVGGGAVLVLETLRAGQRTPALGVLMGYVYLAVPVSGLGIVLFALNQTLDAACSWAEAESSVERHEEASDA